MKQTNNSTWRTVGVLMLYVFALFFAVVSGYSQSPYLALGSFGLSVLFGGCLVGRSLIIEEQIDLLSTPRPGKVDWSIIDRDSGILHEITLTEPRGNRIDWNGINPNGGKSDNSIRLEKTLQSRRW